MYCALGRSALAGMPDHRDRLRSSRKFVAFPRFCERFALGRRQAGSYSSRQSDRLRQARLIP